MSQTEFKNTSFLIGGLIAVTLLITAQVWARSPAPPPAQAVPVQNQPAAASLQLEAAFGENVLIGAVTVSDKDGRPWTGAHGQARLLDSAGQQLALVPLQPLGPGEFRLIAPLSRVDTPGYLDVRLSGQGQINEHRGVYQIDRGQQVVRWVKAAPHERAPLAAQATGGPDEFGYTWDDTTTSDTYDWIDTSGGKFITLRDDDWVGPFDIGFTFNFYGQDYTQFYLDSNGYIGFDSTQTASYYANTYLPFARRPNNLIAPFWDDFDPSQGGAARYQTFGTAPNRYLVVEWDSVPLWGTSDAQSFQLILYEGSNNIKFQYPDTRQGDYGDRSYGTVGIENEDGTIGLEYLYVIPTTITRTVLFTCDRPDYNVFLMPEHQGSSAAVGETASFSLTVRNLGANSDSFILSRPTYSGTNWSVSFYEADGTTPLSGNNTGTIAAGSEKDIVVKIQVPSGATAGDWTRAVIRAASQGNVSEYHEVMLDAMVGSSFVQVYTDNESGDGTEDSENYFDPLQDGQRYTARVTTDQDNSSYAGVAAMPNGNAVNVWNTTYYNGAALVSEIQYAVLNLSGGFVLPVTRLTDNSAATQDTYDFAPSVDVAQNSNFVISWAKQVDTDGDHFVDRYNAWYAVVSSSGTTAKPPAALTNNTSDYRRDYPPSAVALTGGRFLLTWQHAEAFGGPVDIYYVVLNNDGSVYKAITSLTDGTGFHAPPRAAALSDGGAAIVWTAYNADGYPEIAYATVDSTGNVTSGPTMITSNGNSGAGSYYTDAVALSDGRLGVAWSHWPAWPGEPQPNSNHQIQYTILPPTPSPSGGINGRVTYQGSPIAGISLLLRFYDGSSWSTRATATTASDGTYEFSGVPSLSTGQEYYVRYLNHPDGGNTANSNYVAYWFGPTITSYTAGTSASGGDFDIANVPLLSPPNGSTQSLPTTFTWTMRGIAGDYYRWHLFDLSSYSTICQSTPQSDGDFTIGTSGFSTCGLAYGTEYGWNVYIVKGDDWSLGYGASYYYRKITFSSSSSSTPGSGSEERWMDIEPPHRLWPDHHPTTNESVLSARTSRPASALQTIHTVPNELGDANIYVSLTTDKDDNLIMTWLDNYRAQYLFYALADKNGTVQTPATVFQRTRHSYLWSSWNGYGNDILTARTGPYAAYLPAVIANYPPPQPMPTPTQTPIPITNGGFETGNFSGWTQGSDTSSASRPAPIPQVVTSHRHSGGYAAVLGKENDPCQSVIGESGYTLRSWIYQDIWVPTTGSPTLTVWYHIFTYDKLNEDKYDRFEIYINGTLLDRFGNTSSNFGCLSPINDLGWQGFTYNLNAYKGQTIRLKLVNVTNPDRSYSTWTYVDDVTLTH